MSANTSNDLLFLRRGVCSLIEIVFLFYLLCQPTRNLMTVECYLCSLIQLIVRNSNKCYRQFIHFVVAMFSNSLKLKIKQLVWQLKDILLFSYSFIFAEFTLHQRLFFNSTIKFLK